MGRRFLQSFFYWFERQNSAVQAAFVIAVLGLIGVIISGCFQLAAAVISKPTSIVLTEPPPLQQSSPMPSETSPQITPTLLISTNAPTSMPTPTRRPPPTATPTFGTGSTMVSPKDGMVMVYVPEGEFEMGSDSGEKDEQPVHTIYLDAFWIDQTEVTNAMYAQCVQAGKCKQPRSGKSFTRWSYYNNPEFENHPVVFVDWYDARTYCEWASRRLPTEAEWEKAARGADGRVYPWGDSSPNANLLNFDSDFGDTAEVGRYSAGASPYSALDMAGNVWEWVYDWYGESFYASSLMSNPTGPASGGYRVIRGGAWNSLTYENFVQSAFRGSHLPDVTSYSLGFRCARSE
ncbi:MAG: formylglycine-generating enzyme family protein [Chloroflexota bacterium]